MFKNSDIEEIVFWFLQTQATGKGKTDSYPNFTGSLTMHRVYIMFRLSVVGLFQK